MAVPLVVMRCNDHTVGKSALSRHGFAMACNNEGLSRQIGVLERKKAGVRGRMAARVGREPSLARGARLDSEGLAVNFLADIKKAVSA